MELYPYTLKAERERERERKRERERETSVWKIYTCKKDEKL